MRRLQIGLIVLGAVSSLGAVHQTPNFVVHAQNAEVAKQIGQYAEHYRREKALLWLGEEMPQWPQPCPLQVTVSMAGPSGATTFTFSHDRSGRGHVAGMKMEINGPLDRLLASVLPHEITHTVFAHHFKCPVPRWADEGGSVLSEDEPERARHDLLTRRILQEGRHIPMRTLFSLKEYPRDVHCLYAEGFSITEYLVGRSNRQTFLNFLGHGMTRGWDSAAQAFYGHRKVEEMESAWLTYLREGRRPADINLAQRTPAANTRDTRGTVVRLTVPPVQPLDPAPVARGAMPANDQIGQRFGNMQPQQPIMMPMNPGTWQPVQPIAPAPTYTPPAFVPVPVTLGQPVYDPYAPVAVPVYPR